MHKLSPQGWQVHKFGGSSLKKAAHFKTIANLLPRHAIVVLSATYQTTSKLQSLLDEAESGVIKPEKLANLIQYHEKISQTLLKDNQTFKKILAKDQKEIADFLDTICQKKTYSLATQEKIITFGELWSNQLFSFFLGESSYYLNAADFLTLNSNQQVNWQETRNRFNQHLGMAKNTLVIPGFIARSESGQVTTLGRNGSDYSAALIAHLVDAKKLTIWTDVDGIFTAPPNLVKSAKKIDRLSYKEALELAYFGAKVLHPGALLPAMSKNIPIEIRNTFNESQKGTLIKKKGQENKNLIRGISGIKGVSLINIEGTGLMGVSGMASTVFSALKSIKCSVLLISQASSEHSICFALKKEEGKIAQKKLIETFHQQLDEGVIEKIELTEGLSVLVAVGDNMVGRPGVAKKLLNNIAKANINILAISQGSSERNISVVIKEKKLKSALQVTHSGFYLSEKTLAIGIIGLGNVGATFISQLNQHIEKLLKEDNINIKVVALANSKKMHLCHHGILLDDVFLGLNKKGVKFNATIFSKQMKSLEYPHSAIIDLTASDEISHHYFTFVKDNHHVIAANKKMTSGNLQSYFDFLHLCHKKRRHFLYETNVCAGLPVISTLTEMIKTGDEVEEISGVFSGTLSFIFNEVSQGKTFSQAVILAMEKGYSEPDPRDDLSGLDVARKCVCLAREAGILIALEDIILPTLVPEKMQKMTKEDFIHSIDLLDSFNQPLIDKMGKKGHKLAFVATVKNSKEIKISVEVIDDKSPFYVLQGTDNCISFKTKRYQHQPLVVLGPGAGREVTAAGVFSDVLRLITKVS